MGPFGMQACWQRPKGNCISSKHALSFMYPVCPSISRKEKNSIFMHGFPYVHISDKFLQLAHRSPRWNSFSILQVCSNRRRYFYLLCVSSSRVGHGHSSEVALLISRSKLLFLRRRSTGSSRISTPGPTGWAREARVFGQTCIERGLIHGT